MSTPEIQHILTRLDAQEKSHRKHAVEFAEFRLATDERLKVIEPVAEQIAEILNYSRTTSKVVIWTARVAGSIATLVGVIFALARWVM